MGNAFNFDVTEIYKEIKEERDKRLLEEKYWEMDFNVLKEVVQYTEDLDEEELMVMRRVLGERMKDEAREEKLRIRR